MKELLKKSGLIESLWDTPVYRIYRSMLRKQSYDSPGILLDFHKGFINSFDIPQKLWFDVVANTGCRTAIFKDIQSFSWLTARIN